MQDFSPFCCRSMGELGRGALDRKETTEVVTTNLMDWRQGVLHGEETTEVVTTNLMVEV
ncbi:hypothetical protein NG799_07445 [Laspinema sp. D1]|uniref:Uncharacterized protein n=1 Tax=Laspinema palackyanum D2a TaxID=2953684 RepID=A0ABT2MQB7_9CYAN|nr:hypothetical protein [Laspinema sp. D2a]